MRNFTNRNSRSIVAMVFANNRFRSNVPLHLLCMAKNFVALLKATKAGNAATVFTKSGLTVFIVDYVSPPATVII